MQLFAHELASGARFNYAPRMSESPLPGNIRALRKHLDMNQEAFADAVGSAQANVSRWEKRGSIPEPAPLSRMAQMAGRSVTEFMEEPWTPPVAPRSVSDHTPTRSSDVGDTVGIVQLDLSLSMGPGTLIEDFVESEVVSFDASVLRRITRTSSDRLRFVTGIGTSHEPKFQNSDQFLIDINERRLTRIDGYYWITFDGAHALKRLRPLGNGMMQILSDNPDFAPMEVPALAVRIEGRAIWFARGL